MSYWLAFGVGVGVGVVAAVVRRAIGFPLLRLPRGWISDTISGGLIFLSGAVVGGLIAGGFTAGLLLWLGSLVGGLVSPWLPKYVSDEEQTYLAAQEQFFMASRAGDKERVTHFLDSEYADLRSLAVTTIHRRGWQEFVPELVHRVGGEQASDVRSNLASALSSFADPATQAALVALLDDENETTRRLALLGLSRIGDARVPSAAETMYETGGYFARTQAVWSLLVLGTPDASATLQGLIAAQPSWLRRRQAKAVIRRFRKDVARGKSV